MESFIFYTVILWPDGWTEEGIVLQIGNLEFYW